MNRFGFAEYEDMIDLSRSVNIAELTGVLRAWPATAEVPST
ncbi:hypothetical protein [Streptomyces sp. NPDC056056]